LPQRVAGYVFFVVLLNLVPDYLSLLVSRQIVRLMALNPTTARVLDLLVLDTFLTAVAAFIPITCYICVLIIFYPTVPVPGTFLRALGGNIHAKYLGSVCFYGSFFTSVWVWLYVISILLIKVVHKLRPLWLRLLPYLDIEKKPMQAIGRIAGIMAGAGWAVILGLVWAIHHWR
jgi:hypothetical protein